MGIVVSLHGAIAVVEIDRQASLNALDIATVAELEARLRELSADARVRCVVVTGAGERAFIGGADLEYMSRVTAEEARQFAEIGHEVGRLLETMPKPTIAAVNGYALGGGCEVALACDIRYASSNARLGQPEVSFGLIPGLGREPAARAHHDARLCQGADPLGALRRRRGGAQARPRRRDRRPGARKGARERPADRAQQPGRAWRRPRSCATARSRAGIRRISRPSASASRRCS